jgi:hypothetical protein
VDLAADERGVGEQSSDVIPDDLVEVVGADRLVAADPAAFVAVVIGVQAPVVVDRLVGGAGRGAVVAVPAGGAGGETLQQGRVFAVAGGEPLVVGQPGGDPLERLGGNDRRDGDVDPLFAGPVDGLGRAWCAAPFEAGPTVESRGLVICAFSYSANMPWNCTSS